MMRVRDDVARTRALMSIWGNWTRRQNSLANLGYSRPHLIPNIKSHALDLDDEPEILALDAAIKQLKLRRPEWFILISDRFIYRMPLADMAKRYRMSKSSISNDLDQVIVWVDARVEW